MKDYLKLFETMGQYESWLSSNDYIEPSVSHTLDNDVVHYQDLILQAHDYSQDYLTFTALEDTTFKFTTNALQYSLDDGTTWTTLAKNTDSPLVKAGNKILWKQTGLTPGPSDPQHPDAGGIGNFSVIHNFEISGNIMSLYYGDDFGDKIDLTGKDYAFFKIFKNCSKLVNAENLILPATILARSCYTSMFFGCTSLTKAPKLPATTLAILCYQYMFNGCSSLTSAPTILPATTLVDNCYERMFWGCKSLVIAPELPATTLASKCYYCMFYGCTSLTTAPELPATTLTDYCYYMMFNGCTSLTKAPELPATTLANYCYSDMFNGCTSLTTAPELPATTLEDGCYKDMFKNCTSLTTAPELPATILIYYCYGSMFDGCTSLNYIKCLATYISESNNTYNWVNGVSSTGTFVKNASMSSWTTGTNGIPEGWTVQDAA